MQRDVLERLAMDRAMGALSADVEQLLDAYQRLAPEAAATADEIERTVRLARAALAEKQPSSMPAFPVAGFQQIERWRRRVRQFTYAGGLAACLTIGLGLGRMTVPVASAPVPGPSAVEIVQTSDTHESDFANATEPKPTQFARSDSNDNDAGFWSVERLLQKREQEQERLPTPNQSSPSIQVQWPRYYRPT
ncbi:MAG TPA: hypothetical protein PL151_08210 [Phycisphaerae bacterium]|nr:hypothetical protein [Phycisphaerae bacterium]HQE27727.1 hypothetical protein [Phycisphaerae bacterium]